MTASMSNIPSPDPSLATNERLAHAIDGADSRLHAVRLEVKGWVDALQVLHEKTITSGDKLLAEQIKGAEGQTANLDRVVQTRLAGSETALNAAMAAADKVTQKIEINFGAVMNELKAGMTKQIDACNEKIEDLKKRVFESGGKYEGSTRSVSLIISIISAAAVIGMFILVLSRPTTTVIPQDLFHRQTFSSPIFAPQTPESIVNKKGQCEPIRVDFTR